MSLELSSKENTIAEDCLPSGDIATWNSKSCPHQMWTVLDLNADEWRRYSKFTLRLSWPASVSSCLRPKDHSSTFDYSSPQSPANFFVQIHSPESLLTLIPHNSTSKPETTTGRRTRRKYAHIRVVDETDTLPTFTQLASPNRVTFHIILEPLIMGVLPASMQLTALVLVTIVSVAVLAVPWINNYLEQMAQKARREAGQAGAEGMKDE